jgi:hypothetical protein
MLRVCSVFLRTKTIAIVRLHNYFDSVEGLVVWAGGVLVQICELASSFDAWKLLHVFQSCIYQ